MSTPVPRTQIPVKVRVSVGHAAGEESTHDTSYTGVPSTAWSQMPRVSASDKARIWGADADRPRQELFDTTLGQPLLWQERKTPAFWACLLTDLGVKTVVDLTPGSGSAARACMQTRVGQERGARELAPERAGSCSAAGHLRGRLALAHRFGGGHQRTLQRRPGSDERAGQGHGRDPR